MAINLQNSLLAKNTGNDTLYHLGLSKESDDLAGMFGDVKFVCTGGSPTRLHNYAKLFSIASGLPLSDNLCGSDRYSMWKTGPVLWMNHGIGVPSLSVVLNESFKLLHYAGASNVEYFRLGTCGGIDIKAGTVVLSTGTLNGQLEQKHVQFIDGKKVKRDAVLATELVENIFEVSEMLGHRVEKGLTLCCDDFYEGQMRLDGFFCEYTVAEKLDFLQRLKLLGVKNIEMECTAFSALTHRAGIPGAIICVAILDRFEGDQVTLEKSILHSYEMRPFEVASSYILSKIQPTFNVNEQRNGLLI